MYRTEPISIKKIEKLTALVGPFNLTVFDKSDTFSFKF
jgi:hypothetical protein